MHSIKPLWLAALTAGSLFAQGSVRGPMLGWLSDSGGHLKPVLGIPGASHVGAAWETGLQTKQSVVSNAGRFALSVVGDESTVQLVDLRGEAPEPRTLEVPAAPVRMVFSPRGEAAALVYADPARAVLLSGLPGDPRVSSEIDLSAEGTPAVLAVSDDAQWLLAGFEGVEGTIIFGVSGNRWQLDSGSPTALSFLDRSHDAVIGTKTSVLFLQNVTASPETRQLSDRGALSVAATLDGRQLLWLDAEDGRLLAADPAAETVRHIECACAPSMLVRMAGDVFRLNENPGEPIWLVDFSTAGPRAFFVPAEAGRTE